MNYIEALQALKDGKKIRKNSWGKNDYVYIRECLILTNDGTTMELTTDCLSEITDDRWELYQTEEDRLIRNGKRWELYITCANVSCGGCRHDLNKCCQKIGKDTLANMLTDNTISDDEVDKLYKALKGEKD